MNARLATALMALLAAGPVAAPAASADTLLVKDPTAANVSMAGSTAAWSRRADDGTYRLVVRDGGTVADAPVPPSTQPYDPDLGPLAGTTARVIVYARGGDLYRYDIGAGAEQKLTAISSKATERAPSFYKGAVAFSRTGGSRPGWYLARPGKALKRLSKDAPLETDLAATRVTGRFGTASRSLIRQTNYTGDQLRTIARAKAGEKVSSPTLSRFNVYWIRDLAGSAQARAEYVGVNAHRGLAPRKADRTFAAATSLAITNIPALYTSTEGVMSVDPKLRFSGGY
jgi:hypothetical protein